jgi:hypothetical protein
MRILKTHQLYAKMSKCSFGKQEVEYLGHLISENGVQTYPTKVTALTGSKQPTIKD